MKKKLMKKIALALAFAGVISTALASCGQPAEASSSPEPQSSRTSVTVPSSSEDRNGIPPAEENLEETVPVSSEGNDVVPDMEDNADTASTSTSVPDGIPPADAAEPDAGAAAPSSGESQTSAPEGNSLSGIDLNVQFGDDGASFVLHLYDNETAAAIARHVGTADWRLPIYHYDDYDNWEVMQYYDIPSRYEIPSNPQSVSSEKAGTVYYSEPNRIVLFFGDADISSEYTPVGYIDYSQEFVNAVESNPVLEGWGNKIVKISR